MPANTAAVPSESPWAEYPPSRTKATHPPHKSSVVALPCVVNVAGQIGDLAQSALKRGAGAKDSGTLLPGHGGVLDRMDGSLFAFPAVYLFLATLG